ncbi:hypothetical protein [Actinophytocola sp.]|uniref:hypothetical protein n=1 Tax=Actinophytocola sp. TaxID=1872138 RepID=UPI003D6B833B
MTAATRRGTRILATIALVPSIVFTGCAVPGTPAGAQPAGTQQTRHHTPSAQNDAQNDDTGGPDLVAAGRPSARLPGMDRVVLTRMFQHDHWTIDAIAQASPPEKVQYLCETLRPLKPTYVSGLIRLNGTEPVTAEQIEIFAGVKTCLPETRFDVVLNAEDYYDGRGTSLPDRLRHLQQNLQPHGWFFDFFTKPWKAGKADNMRAGMRWIRGHHMFVGGNTWGADNIPDHADFVSVTNLGGVGKAADLARRIKQRHHGLPVLMHIRNDPQKDHTEGLRWIHATPDRREQLLGTHLAGVRAGEFDQYMYPVFFPLSCQRPATSPNRGCVAATHSSYNARADHLLRRMCTTMGRPSKPCQRLAHLD